MVMQNVPVQETVAGIVTALVGGSLMCQSAPFQMAALAVSPFVVALLPTSTHIVAVAQEPSLAPHDEGRVVQKLVSFQAFQVWPFQVSAMGPEAWEPTPLITAHMVLLGQVGTVRTLFGAGAMACQVVPFHTTALESPRRPVAMQKVRVGQDTPASSPPGGLASLRQTPCFHTHARALWFAVLPTAMHQR